MPRTALSTIQDEACTTAYLMPVMLEKMLAQPDFRSFDLSHLRTGTVVTNDPDVMMKAINELGMSGFYSTYGMSELSSVVLRSFSGDTLEVRLNSHGRPMPDIEVRIADPDTGEPLPVGQQGELQVRGYNIMAGYYKKSAETEAAFTANGWFKTGDAGVEREDGNFRFISRLKDGYKMNGTKYKVHLDGYNNLDHWTGKSEKSARREFFYYDETDLMAIRVDNWKMHIGVKPHGLWWDAKYYPSVPYVFNLRMDPMEKMDPHSHEWGYIGRKFLASKLWAPTAAGPFIAAHLKSLMDYPPSQGADTLSLKTALEKAKRMMENPGGSSN